MKTPKALAPKLTKAQEIQVQAEKWYNGNLMKNTGSTDERNASKKLAELTAKDKAATTVPINDTVSLVVGVQSISSEEVDVRKLFELYPDQFWQIISAPAGRTKETIGDRGLAIVTKTESRKDFKITKIKNS